MSVQSELIQKKEEIVARKGMVVVECVEAAEAGLEIFEIGGNAVDAAVASAFASCTCEPAMASLGGGGAALIYLAEEENFQRAFIGYILRPHRIVILPLW